MAPFILCYLLIIPVVLSQSTSHFINPPAEKVPDQNPSLNSVYHVGDIFNIAWSTPEEVVTLIINQQNSSLTEIDYLPNSVALTRQSYSWKVTIDGSDGGSKFDLALDNQFNFQIFKTNGTEALALSAFFNITNSTVDQYGRIIPTTSVSANLPTATTTLRSSTTSIPSTMTPVLPSRGSPTMKPVLTQAPSSKSTTKTILGAVLAIVGFLGLVTGLGVWVFMRQKKARGEQFKSDPTPKYSSREYNELQEYKQGDWKSTSELHAEMTSTLHVAELPS